MNVSLLEIANIQDQINDLLGTIEGQNAPQVKLEKDLMSHCLQFLLLGDLIEKILSESSASKPALSALLLDLLGIYGDEGKSDVQLDPDLKRFCSWAQANQTNWKTNEWNTIASLLQMIKITLKRNSMALQAAIFYT